MQLVFAASETQNNLRYQYYQYYLYRSGDNSPNDQPNQKSLKRSTDRKIDLSENI
jgi:hypothetical protein